MTPFAVWAPHAKSVAVQVAGSPHPLSRDDSGWWRTEISGVKPGSDYAFVVDGSKPLPDPRSPWQPNGVHSPSRLVDHGAFAWTDRHWQPRPLSSAVLYEVHIGTFTPEGTFDSAIEKLDYLRDLGITHVELMPVNEFSGDWGWGYDGVNLFAPHHSYGGPDGLKRLVDACHARHLAVLLDVVYNHFGPTGNYLASFGPYFTSHYKTPWGEAVNLDGPESGEVRRFFIDNALFWLSDYHFDGLRLDAVHALMDASAVHFLEQLADEVRVLEAITGRRKILIAESDLNDPQVVRSPVVGGYGLEAQWSDDFHHALHAVLARETSGYYEDFGRVAQIGKALTDSFVFDGEYSAHRKRRHGRPAVGVSSHRFLGYLQTHDQVGNRARGERIAHLAGMRRAKIGVALVLTSPFIPMLFQGEEFGASAPFQYFTHHDEEALARAVSEGRKREFAAFGWAPADVPDPQDPETFRRSKLDWQELESGSHREMLQWYRDLIALRRQLPELAAERAENLSFDAGEDCLRVKRGSIHLVCNLGEAERSVREENPAEIVLSSDSSARIEEFDILLPGDSCAIIREKNARGDTLARRSLFTTANAAKNSSWKTLSAGCDLGWNRSQLFHLLRVRHKSGTVSVRYDRRKSDRMHSTAREHRLHLALLRTRPEVRAVVWLPRARSIRPGPRSTL